jgi:hypothetical protein
MYVQSVKQVVGVGRWSCVLVVCVGALRYQIFPRQDRRKSSGWVHKKCTLNLKCQFILLEMSNHFARNCKLTVNNIIYSSVPYQVYAIHTQNRKNLIFSAFPHE